MGNKRKFYILKVIVEVGIILFLSLFLAPRIIVDESSLLSDVCVIQVLGILLAAEIAVLVFMQPTLLRAGLLIDSKISKDDSTALINHLAASGDELDQDVAFVFVSFGLAILGALLHEAFPASQDIELICGLTLGQAFSAIKIFLIFVSLLCAYDSILPVSKAMKAIRALSLAKPLDKDEQNLDKGNRG